MCAKGVLPWLNSFRIDIPRLVILISVPIISAGTYMHQVELHLDRLQGCIFNWRPLMASFSQFARPSVIHLTLTKVTPN